MSDFTWVPSYTTEGSDKFAELSVSFGDGYVQTMPDGINPVMESWTLVFDSMPIADFEAMRAFLRGRVGQTFTWTHREVEKVYRRVGDLRWRYIGPETISCTVTIEEAFGS